MARSRKRCWKPGPCFASLLRLHRQCPAQGAPGPDDRFRQLDLEVKDGVVVHPARWPEKKWTWVVISNAGFPERSTSPPGRPLPAVCPGDRRGNAGDHRGMILKGMGEMFSFPPCCRITSGSSTPAGRGAGGCPGRLHCGGDARKVLDRPLVDISMEEFAAMSNAFIEMAVKKARKRKKETASEQGG